MWRCSCPWHSLWVGSTPFPTTWTGCAHQECPSLTRLFPHTTPAGQHLQFVQISLLSGFPSKLEQPAWQKTTLICTHTCHPFQVLSFISHTLGKGHNQFSLGSRYYLSNAAWEEEMQVPCGNSVRNQDEKYVASSFYYLLGPPFLYWILKHNLSLQ